MSHFKVAFLWHMHQPDYRMVDVSDRSLLPWVRLHASKSYFDMPWLLARFPTIKCTINLVGSLLQQLVLYRDSNHRDRFWDLTLADPESLDDAERAFICKHFFSLHHRIRQQSVRYEALFQKRALGHIHFCHQELLDLQVHFNLGWMGFAARETYPRIKALVQQDRDFTQADKEYVCTTQIAIVAKVLELYRELQDAGQIEISTTPMYHPILPLVISSESAKRCSPERETPSVEFSAPDDASWHIEASMELYQKVFGRTPLGMWPAEGSVSPEAVKLFSDAGLQWVATDEEVLFKALSHNDHALIRGAWQLTPSLKGLFRDRRLSDLIGFDYARADAIDAASDLVAHLEQAAECGHGTAVILDGENPWEAYTDDGRPFLEAFYTMLSESENLQAATMADLAATPSLGSVPKIHSGSWIHANFNIWCGAPETNTAWTRLARARQAVRRCEDTKAQALALQHLYIAEGSDWFWWYGDDFSAEDEALFDALFLGRLRAAYRAINAVPPAETYVPIAKGTRTSNVEEHTMPRRSICPRLDATRARFYEWRDAGTFLPHQGGGSMMKAQRYISRVRYGFGASELYFQVVPCVDSDPEGLSCDVVVVSPQSMTMSVVAGGGGVQTPLWRGVFREVAEIGIDMGGLGVGPGDRISVQVVIRRGSVEVDRVPRHGSVELSVPSDDHDERDWLV